MGRSRGDQQGFLLGLVIPVALSHLLAALKPILLLNQLQEAGSPYNLSVSLCFYLGFLHHSSKYFSSPFTLVPLPWIRPLGWSLLAGGVRLAGLETLL